MTTPEKCEAILREIHRRCNENTAKDPTEMVVGFGPDWGGYALTLYIDDSHTHVGYVDGGNFEGLIDSVHKRLIDPEAGLSLAIPADRVVQVKPE